jgi:hypothetical protein
MKNWKLFIILLSISSFSFSQEEEPKNIAQRIHEIRLDGVKLIAGPIAEVTYEFVKNENSGYGVSILANLGSDYNEDFSITPFYRMYFFTKQDYGANGFFVEGFGKLVTGDEYDYVFDEEDEKNNYTDFSLGMSLGKKWVNKNGFVFELLLGVSRALGSDDSGPEAYLRGGLFVGYRF